MKRNGSRSKRENAASPTPPQKKSRAKINSSHEASPLHIVCDRQNQDQPIILRGKDGILSDFIHPMKPEEFLTTHFRRTAVHVPTQMGVKRAQAVIEQLLDLDPEGILTETASDAIFCWIQHSDGDCDAKSATRLHSIQVDAAAAITLHKAGHATYCRAPPELEQLLVGKMMQSTGYGYGQYDPTGTRADISLGRGEVEILMGTPNHRTGWHTDFQENFTIQLSGSKRWRLQSGTVAHTLRGITPHYQSPESVEPQLLAGRLGDPKLQFCAPQAGRNASGPIETVVLNPGDVLYFPAGMWHEVETLEAGVSLNISLMARSYASVVAESLEHLLLQHDDWRQRVTRPLRTTGSQGDGEDVHLQKLLESLPQLVQDFATRGGARAILPPCVGHEPNRMEGGKQDEESVVDSNGSDEEDQSSEDIDDEHEEDGALLEPPYKVPESHRWSASDYQTRFQTHDLIRNPLASFLRQDEVTEYYYPKEDEDNIPGKEILILNVNFAGNDGHQPSVRKVFHYTNSSSEGLVSYFLRQDTTATDRATVKDIDPTSDLNIANALLFYGGLVWVKRDA